MVATRHQQQQHRQRYGDLDTASAPLTSAQRRRNTTHDGWRARYRAWPQATDPTDCPATLAQAAQGMLGVGEHSRTQPCTRTARKGAHHGGVHCYLSQTHHRAPRSVFGTRETHSHLGQINTACSPLWGARKLAGDAVAAAHKTSPSSSPAQ